MSSFFRKVGEIVNLRYLPLLLLGLVIITSCSDMEISIPGSGKALFREEFVLGRTGTWLLESDEIGSAEIIPEQLLIEINAPNTVQYVTLEEPAFSDFTLEVDGRLLQGALSSSYGVLFRMKSPQEFYRFEITGDGMYLLERHDDSGGWVRLLDDWRDTVAINKGLDAVNRLKIDANGSKISLYVNDNLLEEIQDPTYSSGKIALDAGTFGNPNLRVSFDNLIIYPPSSE